MTSYNVSGYVQQIGMFSFHAVCYSEQQVRMYTDACKSTATTVHLDTTGTVVSNIYAQKWPLYYCMLYERQVVASDWQFIVNLPAVMWCMPTSNNTA